MAHLPIFFTDLAPAQSLRALLLGLGPVYDPGQAPPLLVLVHSMPYDFYCYGSSDPVTFLSFF